MPTSRALLALLAFARSLAGGGCCDASKVRLRQAATSLEAAGRTSPALTLRFGAAISPKPDRRSLDLYPASLKNTCSPHCCQRGRLRIISDVAEEQQAESEEARGEAHREGAGRDEEAPGAQGEEGREAEDEDGSGDLREAEEGEEAHQDVEEPVRAPRQEEQDGHVRLIPFRASYSSGSLSRPAALPLRPGRRGAVLCILHPFSRPPPSPLTAPRWTLVRLFHSPPPFLRRPFSLSRVRSSFVDY